jgi:hypothetical protein
MAPSAYAAELTPSSASGLKLLPSCRSQTVLSSDREWKFIHRAMTI